MASRRQAALLRRRAVLRWRHALLRVASSTYFVLCFDNVRRTTSCFVLCFDDAICFSLAICLLCATCFAPMHAKDAAVGESNCLRCLSLAAFPLSLSPLEEEVLAFPFLSFLAGRTQDRDSGYCVHSSLCVPSTCFCWRCKPCNRKFLRASRRFVLPAL